MNFTPAAWQIRRARVAQEKWNLEHPDKIIPWELVEEAVLAWRTWKELVTEDPTEALYACERHQEFARKLPEEFYRDIWPT